MCIGKCRHCLRMSRVFLLLLFLFLTQLRGNCEVLHIVIVVCGNRGAQAFDALKSIILGTDALNAVRIHLFAEPLESILKDVILPLDQLVKGCARGAATYKIYDIDSSHQKHDSAFWSSKEKGFWTNRYRCSAQRLYSFQALESSVDAALYVDTDTLVLQNVHQLLHQLQAMRSQSALRANHSSDVGNHFEATEACSAASTCPSRMTTSTGGIIFSAADHCALSYVQSQRVPFYEPRGLQAGVIFVNITLYRTMNVLSEMDSILSYPGFDLKEGDQDALNIYASRHQNAILVMPPEYNWWGEFADCPLKPSVSNPEALPVILHGADMRWYLPIEPEFVKLYNLFHSIDVCKPFEDRTLSFELRGRSHVIAPAFWNQNADESRISD
ncbi:hypothetical protein CEUSTIGMA_g13670.t1 [Chlamydomonas eustigma]|uniref:Uncharacterized protein n=1 Tax=Chlamydomonas eustigma TaxID=1157962 RepID=A0A250XT72_9CHLO|nr:hypothetical protein CEUSTIGMA_g13670.t1 [Chlamydomonas eustigma]|eukprot:GAX86258.1 hypothetical protein CEUSTIGMA_g13670.t1 [Chlamydomonas eustigma]